MKHTVTEMKVRRFLGDVAYSIGRWLVHKSFSVRNGGTQEISLRSVFGETLYGLGCWFEFKSDQVRVPASAFSEPVSKELGDEADIAACGFMPTIFLNSSDPAIREALIRGYGKATPDVSVDDLLVVDSPTAEDVRNTEL